MLLQKQFLREIKYTAEMKKESWETKVFNSTISVFSLSFHIIGKKII